MARESCSGTKELLQIYLTKDLIKKLKNKAHTENRKISAQAETILSEALQENK